MAASGSPLTLYMMGSGVPIESSGSINLYIGGKAQFSANDNLDLFIFGCDAEFISWNRLTTGKYNNLNDNNWWRLRQGYYEYHKCIGSGINLFIEGFGTTEGYIPSNDALNLTIIGPQGSSSGLDLFLLNNDNPSNNIDIYLPSVSGVPSGSLDLFMNSSDTQDSGDDPLWLFSRGWSG